MKYKCPVCGFNELKEPAYDKFGCSSFNICPCCGTEFGYHDSKISHKVLREKWVIACTPFHFEKEKPKNWDPKKQLENAGLLDNELLDIFKKKCTSK